MNSEKKSEKNVWHTQQRIINKNFQDISKIYPDKAGHC